MDGSIEFGWERFEIGKKKLLFFRTPKKQNNDDKKHNGKKHPRIDEFDLDFSFVRSCVVTTENQPNFHRTIESFNDGNICELILGMMTNIFRLFVRLIASIMNHVKIQ